MAGETLITVVGNLVGDPEVRYTQAGVAVANFTVASTPRTFDKQANEWKDGEALFLRCALWRDAAENVGNSLAKGTRVIVQGRLQQRSYQDKEGNNRTSIELDVEEIGPSLRYATAQVARVENGGHGSRTQQRNQQQERQYTPGGSPAGTYNSPATYDSDTPF
jgi:single-strand DNA-binding protein